jgi:hypothetical protein
MIMILLLLQWMMYDVRSVVTEGLRKNFYLHLGLDCIFFLGIRAGPNPISAENGSLSLTFHKHPTFILVHKTIGARRRRKGLPNHLNITGAQR